MRLAHAIVIANLAANMIVAIRAIMSVIEVAGALM
jgi:hypothetical protein